MNLPKLNEALLYQKFEQAKVVADMRMRELAERRYENTGEPVYTGCDMQIYFERPVYNCSYPLLFTIGARVAANHTTPTYSPPREHWRIGELFSIAAVQKTDTHIDRCRPRYPIWMWEISEAYPQTGWHDTPDVTDMVSGDGSQLIAKTHFASKMHRIAEKRGMDALRFLNREWDITIPSYQLQEIYAAKHRK
jgi:hypothetical protein